MGEKIKVWAVISGIALISGFIYCIVNQNWSDAFLLAALFFILCLNILTKGINHSL
jgi:hypothetical protein